MKVLLIATQHTMAVHGPSRAKAPLTKLSSVLGNSVHYSDSPALFHLILCRFLVLPALSLNDGVLHCDIVKGSFDTTGFYTFIECLLDTMQPLPAPNSVIVMDNCWIHKHLAIVELIESRYFHYFNFWMIINHHVGVCAVSICHLILLITTVFYSPPHLPMECSCCIHKKCHFERFW